MSYSISSLFGQSPVRPIQHHMKKAQACVGLLEQFLDATTHEQWEEAVRVQAAIGELEDDADLMKNELRAHMPKSLLMPVARSDVLALLSMQDKLANRAKDIAGLMLGRKMKIPDALAHEFRNFLKKSVESSENALRAIEELDTLFESGFDSREQNRVMHLVEQIDSLESECDELQINLRAQLMEIEENLPPVHVMFLYQVIEKIADISDISHRVGNRLTILLAK